MLEYLFLFISNTACRPTAILLNVAVGNGLSIVTLGMEVMLHHDVR